MALNFNGNTPVAINYNNNDVLVVKWNGVVVWEKIAQYLAFTATSNGTFTFVGSDRTNRISYSLDSGETWSSESTSVSINVNSGDIVMWKGEMTPQTGDGVGTFGGTASFDASGNILSIEYGDNFNGQTDFSTQAGFDFTYLFQGSNIESAERLKLPVEVLTNNCYDSMFDSCASLTTPPLLPSTTLATGCYWGMFVNCTSLETAPELPAETLALGCYGNMFQGCTSLETAPELLAETLEDYCYQEMFFDCSSLNYIKMVATDISATDCLENWVYGVAASGTFVKATDMTSLPIDSVDGVPEGWTLEDDFIDYSLQYLTFIATSNGTFVFDGITPISYSTDEGATWSSPSYNTTINVNVGDKVLWKGNMSSSGKRFSGGTASFEVQGNIMSLLYGDNFVGQTHSTNTYFQYTFSKSNVTNAENLVLPETTMTYGGYQRMFEGCTSLIKSPKILPATTLATACYEFMFKDCSAMTTSPILPATTANITACYSDIFRNCSSLNYIKAMFINTPSTTGQNNWVNGVAASGTFVMNAAAPWNPESYRGVYGVPQGWTVQYATE